METKTCIKCGIEKTIEEFSPRINQCKKCKKEYNRNYREKLKNDPYIKEKSKEEGRKKVCPDCRIEKNLSEFYKNKTKHDGHEWFCISCHNKRSEKYRKIKHEILNEYFRNRNTIITKDKNLYIERYERGKKYRKENKERIRKSKTEYQRRERETEKLKYKAYGIVSKMIRSGKLKKGKCEFEWMGDCRYKIGSHHEDYSKPLDIHWLCGRHHAMVERGRLSLTSPNMGTTKEKEDGRHQEHV